jgi:hypothetical protein
MLEITLLQRSQERSNKFDPSCVIHCKVCGLTSAIQRKNCRKNQSDKQQSQINEKSSTIKTTDRMFFD